MRIVQLLILLLFFSIKIVAQGPLVEARCSLQTIPSYTQAMDQGAHAIHLNLIFGDTDIIIKSGEKLSDAIKAIEWHLKSYTRYEVKYILNLKEIGNIQLSSKVLYDLVDSYIPIDRVTIKSDDYKILRHWHKVYPQVKLAVISNSKKSIDTNLVNLKIKPNYYYVEKESLTESMSKNLHKRGIGIVPFVVNDITLMQQVIKWKVDRIITDSLHLSQSIGLNKKVKNGTN